MSKPIDETTYEAGSINLRKLIKQLGKYDGSNYVDLVLELIDNAEVSAICDNNKPSIDASLELLKNNIPTFESHIDLMNAEIADAYIIATPNFTHINILKDITKTKANLLIEKPLCTKLEDCLELNLLTNLVLSSSSSLPRAIA